MEFTDLETQLLDVGLTEAFALDGGLVIYVQWLSEGADEHFGYLATEKVTPESVILLFALSGAPGRKVHRGSLYEARCNQVANPREPQPTNNSLATLFFSREASFAWFLAFNRSTMSKQAKTRGMSFSKPHLMSFS
jgi:hypothetical protein